MPTTRAQSSRMSQSVQDTADYEGFSDEEDLAEDPEEEPEAPSSLVYDRQGLSPNTKERLEAAFEGRYVVEHCSERTESGVKYYVFQTAETAPHSVRIRVPGANHSNVECSNCNEQQPCRHVFWLMDQINKYTLSDAQKQGSLTLSPRGYPIEVPEPYVRISQVGIQELAELAGWELRPERYHEPDQESKAEEIREILAALSPKTADEYRPDIFDHLVVDQSFEGSLARRDLPSLLAKSLMTNPDMFHHFRAIVSPNFCAADFFRKMKTKSNDALRLLDNYLDTGRADDSHVAYDIPWCAKTLIEIVEMIRNKIIQSALLKSAKAEAAETLTHILAEVVRRNANAYAGRVWDGTPQRQMPEKEKNLYYRLIVSPSRSSDPSFVIHELYYLADSSQHLVDRMEVMGQQMRQNGVPSKYWENFTKLIHQMKRADMPSMHGTKRSASDDLNDNKTRMKSYDSL